MFNRMATGDEIYEILMRDAAMCRDENDQLIFGDCNLWYLGCNEKFGCLRCESKVFPWEMGESCFARLTIFIGMLYKDGVFTVNQFENLYEKVLEGRQIDCLYDIKDHLSAQRKGKP